MRWTLTDRLRLPYKLRMPPKLTFVASPDDVLESVKVFNRDYPDHLDLCWDVLRRTTYWVLDSASEAFGPSKFVGFKGMNFTIYAAARSGNAVGDRFDGHATRGAIERVGPAFEPNAALHDQLRRWAERIAGPQVAAGLDESKWNFACFGILNQRPENDEPPSELELPRPVWAPLTERTIGAIPRQPGAYRIRVVTDDGRAHVIRRCFGDDAEGIIDIGESKNLRVRLSSLLRCMRDVERGGHMAGWRYAFLGMQALFPIERLQVWFEVSGSKDEAYAREGELLAAYVRRHYELPPLNYKFNWSSLADDE